MEKKARARRSPRVQNYPFIPEEIVLNILGYLPIKSLLRFRCVSKGWTRWICELRESRKKLLVVSRNSSTSRHSFRTIGGQRVAAQLEVLNAPQPWDDARFVKIYGSCNELVLIGIDNNLYLWNPSIQWYSHISFYDVYCDCDVAVSGLCLDSTRNEYKAVFGWKRKSPQFLDSPGTPEYLEVCSLKNKYMEYIEFPYDLGSGKSGPSMNDRLHWVVSAEVGFFVPQFIVCFEAKTDEFEEFPMPDVPKGKAGNPILGLGVLDGCLCMVLCEENAIYEGPVQVMSMKEYGVKESWTILFRIKDIRYSYYVVPIFYAGEENTDIIMEITPGYVVPRLYAGEENTNSDIIMEGISGERGRSISVYKINGESYASFLKVVDIAPLPKYAEAIVYEETFVIPTLCEEVL